MIMSTLHHLTPDQRHGEALAFRSMAINASSTLMPLLFGAAGTVVGAAVLFWVVGAAVGAGSWLARRLGAPRPEPRQNLMSGCGVAPGSASGSAAGGGATAGSAARVGRCAVVRSTSGVAAGAW